MTWRERLTKAVENGDSVDHAALAAEASEWPTCLIGEHRGNLEAWGYTFQPDGCPDAEKLRMFGATFAAKVRYRLYRSALDCVRELDDLIEQGIW